jgi:AraC-like DNA-binding protein
MKMQISTGGTSAPDRVAFWADLVCAHLVEVECNSVVDPTNFSGSVTKMSLPQIEIAKIHAGGQIVRRTSRLLREAERGVVLINIQRSGSSRLRQSGRDALLNAGDLAIYSSDSPYELAFESDFDQTVLMFSKHALPSLRDNLDRMGAIAVRGTDTSTRFLTSLADAVFDAGDDLHPELTNALQQTLFQSILAATARLPQRESATISLAQHHLARIRQYACNNLSDPQLSVARIAKGVGLSPSHVHRLMAGEPQTLMEWVSEKRLLSCQMDLAASWSASESISQIAFRYGFIDMSHFSRAYRRRFGMSPRESRARVSHSIA